MEKDQIAILRRPRSVKSSKGYILWEAGEPLIATKVMKDYYLVNSANDNVVHCTVFAKDIIILKWQNKWKRVK